MKSTRLKLVLAIVSVAIVSICAGSFIRSRYAVRRFPTPPEPTGADSADFVYESHTHLSPSEMQELLSGDCAVVRLPNEIPQAIRNAFATMTREKPFALAEPGARFNATDLIEPNLPTRRLVFAGACDNRWLIQYEHGGIGKSVALSVMQLNKDESVSFIWGRALHGPAANLNELRNAIKSGDFYDYAYHW